MTFCLVFIHILEILIIERVSAGSIICSILSANPTFSDKTPIGTLSATGNHPNFTENNIINNITDERFGKKRRGKRNTEDVG